MTDYHESADDLDDRTKDTHRALISLKEEIEAVDWYSQRVACCSDQSLRRILQHNRDEEIEHACMTLEWLRRAHPEWNACLKTYLFTTTDITRAEKSEHTEPVTRSVSEGLGIGDSREVEA